MSKIARIIHRKTKGICNNYYLTYTVLFVLFFIGAFGIFWYYGRAPIWDSDAISQHYPNFIYVRSWVQNIIENFTESGKIEIDQWDSSIGLGQDFLNVISFRPSSLLAAFFSKSFIVFYIWLTIAIRFYIVGIAFSKYCLYIKTSEYATLIATILYTFSSFSLVYGTKHYMFVDMMIFLPLLCLGLEKIMYKEKPWLFILGVFASAWTYFYMLYIVAIFVLLYFIIRYTFRCGEKSIRQFLLIILKCGVGGISGLVLAAASLLPTLLLTFESSRYGETVEKSYTSFWHYSRNFYLEFFTYIFTPKYMYLGLVLGFSGLLGIGVLYLFLQKKRIDIKIGIIVITFLLLIPFSSYVFNGFSGYTLRWSFGLTFVLCIMLAILLPEILNMSSKKLIIVLSIIGTYTFILLVLYFNGTDINLGGVFSILLFAFLLMIFCAKRNFYDQSAGKILLLLAVFVEITVKSISLYSPYGENYLNEFYNSDTVMNEVDALSAKVATNIEDDSVYRVDEIDDTFFESVYNRNYGQRTGVNGVSTFYSYSTGNIKKYIEDLGIAQQPTPFCILGLTHRTALNTLNSVKYATTYNPDSNFIPFGYEKIGVAQSTDVYGEPTDVYIYENQYALPYMFTYDSYIPDSEYEQLNALEKEQAMLQGIVLEEEVDYPKTTVKKECKTLLTKDDIIAQINEKYQDSTEIAITERGISTLKDGVSITLDFQGIDNAETYVWFDNLEFIPMVPTLYQDIIIGENADKLTIKQFQAEYRFWDPPVSARIVCNDGQTIYLNDEYAQYYSGKVEAVGNLGYSENAQSQVTLYFSTTGEYNFSDMKIMTYSMDDYIDKVTDLQKNGVNDIAINSNAVTGNIELDDSKFVCINIPKSNGWKAYINGEETEIYTANGMYMGILAQKGVNNITLVYQTPGLKIGLMITLVGFLILIIVYLCSRRLNRRKVLKRRR